MKKLVIALILLSFPLAIQAERILVDGVAARVNDEVVTVGEVMRLMAPSQQALLQQYRGDALKTKLADLYKDTLNSLIERRLILSSYEEQDMKIPDWLVEERIDDVIRDNFKGDRSELMSVLARERISYAEWKEQWEERIIVASMRGSFVGQNIKIAPKAISDKYEQDKDKYHTSEKVRFRMIFVKLVQGAEQAAKERADAVLAKIAAGESFSELATEFSDGRHAKDGGDWGWVEPDVLRSEISQALDGLGAGDVSGLIETKGGYYILKVEERKKGAVSPLEEVRDAIERELHEERGKQIYDAWVQRLKADAYVEIVDLELFGDK